MTFHEGDEQARSTADAVARRSYGKLVAFLAARIRDVAAAEDALSEAFAAALADWPRNGCPSNPEAWLLTVARRKAIDMHRGRLRHEIAGNQLRVMAEGLDAAAAESEIPDQRLALMFACAHPAIDAGIRAPLILQVVLGLDAAMIAVERSSYPRLPWANASSVPKTKSAKLASRFAFRSAKNFPAAWTPCSKPFTPRSPKDGPILAEPMWLAAISPKNRFFLARLVVEMLPARARGSRSACSHASRRSPPSRAPQRGRRIRSPRRTGSGAVGLAD